MFKLIKIKETGMRVTLTDSSDVTGLISSVQQLQQGYPNLQFSIVGTDGVIVWPARVAS